MAIRGIRGAISVEENSVTAINAATVKVLQSMITTNQIAVEDIVSVFFTATADIDAVYPAQAAREMGWVNVPMLCFQEMQVRDSLKKIIRVLLHVNTDKNQAEIIHVYLGEAQKLRPDLTGEINNGK
ncbi:chorismate mutase [Zhaonella formicivorans]|uniref:chorismate mutase n=1 Tax=Zhaonella formicivorans TaxID=2528593 RepID=UPI0010E7DCB0|nr:chorismate mutase [Zhaonella formicivorans]